ncbi:MAG: nickel-responsive transcriptional regulator NikR [Gammaproteobacteria bacterium]|nr:nickel-responsive transcriptional regulator NikR [Gammaproteobacteria bacterium]
MERITISLDTALAEQFDTYIAEHGYTNRSEAMRDLIRKRLEMERLKKSDDGYCVAALSYVYNHHEMELASRITNAHHRHHELNVSSMHVHLDHDNCLEVAVMRGAINEVRDFANAVMAERGVRHGKLHMVPVGMAESTHQTGGKPHVHSSPLT